MTTYEFRLPDIGEGVVEGEVVKWLVEEGDLLKEDQPMVEVMTDKATVEIPAPRAGRVVRRMFAEGERCPVGKVLISIDTSAEPTHAAGIPAPLTEPTAPASFSGGGRSVAVEPRATNGTGGGGAGVLALPATRKLAREMGVDISTVEGSGPAGRITSDDVKAHGGSGGVSARAPGDAGDVRIPFRGLRKKIAENLVRSKQLAPHVTYVEEVDCTALVALRARVNEQLARGGGPGGKLSFLPFIIRATVGALRAFPQMNAMLDEAAGEIVQRRRYHIGLATATESGLVVPVVRDADQKSLLELGREIERLAGLTRDGKAGREELTGSTFTVTSLGAWGGVMATAIINPPEVAILGVHKIARRPAVVGDEIEIRELMNLSLSFDHRVVDGYDAARFVGAIKATLEAPDSLTLDLG